ncbi:thioredoxin-like protein [Chaetomium strumarium]|uniref:Thioredoxin-like protein n=1 Tax=Chaetomium strumarium TaxID=1170767 RepID=A0AAJ0GUW2_9PEZI|nr:thioredoxin-like protein [Chaetomium strumarium]
MACSVTEICDEKGYNEFMKGTVVLNLYSKTCWPCTMISPVFDNFSYDEDFANIRFAKVNRDVPNEGLRGKLSKFNISATPTFLLLRDGVMVESVVGADVEGLMRMLEKTAEEDKPAATGEVKSPEAGTVGTMSGGKGGKDGCTV